MRSASERAGFVCMFFALRGAPCGDDADTTAFGDRSTFGQNSRPAADGPTGGASSLASEVHAESKRRDLRDRRLTAPGQLHRPVATGVSAPLPAGQTERMQPSDTQPRPDRQASDCRLTAERQLHRPGAHPIVTLDVMHALRYYITHDRLVSRSRHGSSGTRDPRQAVRRLRVDRSTQVEAAGDRGSTGRPHDSTRKPTRGFER